MKVTYGANGKVLSAKLNGKDIKPEQTYKVGTINFLVNGGDGMGVLSKGTVLFTDTEPYGEHILNYVKNLSKQGKKISADENRDSSKNDTSVAHLLSLLTFFTQIIFNKSETIDD